LLKPQQPFFTPLIFLKGDSKLVYALRRNIDRLINAEHFGLGNEARGIAKTFRNHYYIVMARRAGMHGSSNITHIH
jgi:hypothetical protein